MITGRGNGSLTIRTRNVAAQRGEFAFRKQHLESHLAGTVAPPGRVALLGCIELFDRERTALAHLSQHIAL